MDISNTKLGEDLVKEVMTSEIEKKKERVRKYRTEASRLASMANKRLQRLEKAGLTDSPAYRKWVEDGKVKFGVRGKDHRQLQKEVARMNKFLESKTSTIRGVNTQLKEMAQNTGIAYRNLKELRENASKFFELSSKVEQYLRTVDKMASAIGYQKIWQAVNTYVKDEEIVLSSVGNDIDLLVKKVSDAIIEYEKQEQFKYGSASGWFQLDKE